MFTRSVRRFARSAAVVALAIVAVACGAAQPSATPAATAPATPPPSQKPPVVTPSPMPLPSPSPAGASLLLEVTSEGGFINPSARLGQLPSVVVDSAGHFYMADPNATDNPLIAHVVVRDVGSAGAAAILAAMRAAGLDVEGDDGGISADTGVTIFTTTGPSAAGGIVVANVADITRGGSRRFTVPITAPAPLPAGDPAVVIQLDDGSFVAYDALCTHEGCRVGWEPSSGVIVCPCHSAEFDAANHGVVLSGPTNIPLPELPLIVNQQDGTIALAIS